MATHAGSCVVGTSATPRVVARRARDFRGSGGGRRLLGDRHHHAILGTFCASSSSRPKDVVDVRRRPLATLTLGGGLQRGVGALEQSNTGGMRQRRGSSTSVRGAAIVVASAAAAAADGPDDFVGSSDGAEDSPSSSSSSSSSSDTGKSLRVASYIFGWYFLNAVFAIINKRKGRVPFSTPSLF